MPIITLYGHDATRARLADMLVRGALPHSILLHGPRGVGKQRLALWLGTALLCSADQEIRPCGQCQHCRYSADLAHPDLHWFFPRPRLKDGDADADEVREDYRDAIADRVKAGGLYPPPSGNEGIYVATIRALVAASSMSPALARRKVFVIGNAERMVPQEGSDQAANALLKLLEEPSADTTLVLTTSEPGALLPTIRSRVVAFRIGPVGDEALRRMFADPIVARRLDAEGAPSDADDRIRAAAGSPGMLLGGPGWDEALQGARRLLDTIGRGDRGERIRSAFAQGGSRARGGFSDMLEALAMLLHQKVREAALAGDEARATGAARAVEAVERTKDLARGNVSPQLATAALLRDFDTLGL